MDDAVISWLLEGDPSVRWRVLRDLAGAPAREAERERAKVATEGWGARLLAQQHDHGGWGGGVYSPKWTSTTYTLLHLMWLGLPPGHPAALRGCARLWEWQSRWRAPETCIVSMLIRLTVYFGYATDRLGAMVDHLLGEQLDDGGWNCHSRGDKAKHSSFHTSIQALEALAAQGVDNPRGREFFLRHKLYRSHRTGEVAIPSSLRFPAFPEWHFDVMRGLEYFRGGARDERLADAVGVIRKARRRDGTWSTYSQYAGEQFFRLEPPGASRVNTLRALRVLNWWDG
jgi:hypothetical protein